MSRQVTSHLMRWSLMGLMLFLAACNGAQAAEPPPTLQAAVEGSEFLTNMDPNDIEVLQEQAVGGGRLMLYRWLNEADETCVATTYLTTINRVWQTHDTITATCRPAGDFMAAHSGNSHIDAPFGPPRQTVVFGTSEIGRAVRVVWVDGQVSHIPLENGAFLDARSGRWGVERVELLDAQNNIILTEDWRIDMGERSA